MHTALLKGIIKKIIICFNCIIFLSSSGTSQTNSVPAMWVSKSESIKRQKNFKGGFFSGNNYKYKLLSKKIGKDETRSIFYPIDSIRALFKLMCNENKDYKYLNIYIASFNKDYGSNYFNVNDDKKLTIIFSPANDQGIDLGKFYIIDKDNHPQSISSLIKEKWAENYIKEKCPVLLSTIDLHAKENYPNNDITNQPSDTRVICYSLHNINRVLQDEVEYQLKNGNKINVTGIQVNFAAYPDEGICINGVNNLYKNRLILQFEFTRKKGNKQKVFYIDDQPGFQSRPKDKDPTDCNILPAFDNGQLCPPTCK